MNNLPSEIVAILLPFSQLFLSGGVENRGFQLLIGAILTRGPKTVSGILRTIGRNHEDDFSLYHHVLNRNEWDQINGGRILLAQIIVAFNLSKIKLVVDCTTERRKGKKIDLIGNHRDAVRSSSKRTNYCDGIRWLVVAASVELPFASRTWTLPFLSVSCPPKKWYKDRGREALTAIDRTIQVLKLIRRWFPNITIELIGDGDFGNVKLGNACAKLNIELISRLRNDACLFEYIAVDNGWKRGKALPKIPEIGETGNWEQISINCYGNKNREVQYTSGVAVRHVRGTGENPIRYVITIIKSISKEPICLFSTNLSKTPEEIISAYMERWSIEVTFQECRAHLGVETNREWSEKAISRETPILFGLYTMVVLCSLDLYNKEKLSPRESAWYKKENITFSDALAETRTLIWEALKNGDLEDLFPNFKQRDPLDIALEELSRAI